MDTLLTPAELAAHISVSTSTLKQWRYLQTGPPYLKLGGLVRYPLNTVNEWLSNALIDNNQ